MSITILTDQGSDLTTVVATDRLSREEIEQVITEFYAGQPTRKVVWDLDAASIAHFEISDIKDIVRVLRERIANRPEGKTAIVTNHDVDYGMARMGEAFAHDIPLEIMIFRSRESAERWLNTNQ